MSSLFAGTREHRFNQVECHGIDSGHFAAEENPQRALQYILPLFARHAH